MFSKCILILSSVLLLTKFGCTLDSITTPLSISCRKTLNSLLAKQEKRAEEIFVRCDCSHFYLEHCFVFGNLFYAPTSSVCCSGIHDGKLDMAENKTEMVVVVHYQSMKNFNSAKRNGIKSRSDSLRMKRYFTLSDMPVLTTTTKTTTTTAAAAATTTMSSAISSAYNSPTTLQYTTTILSSSIAPRTSQSLQATVAALSANENRTQSLTTVTLDSTTQTHATPHDVDKLGEQPLSSEFNDAQPTTTVAADSNDAQNELLSTTSHQIVSEFPEHVPNRDENNLDSTSVIWIMVSLSAILITLIPIIFIIYRRRSSHWRFLISLRRNRGGAEPCVCFVQTDSSQQSLLNDPETCERSCVVREAVLKHAVKCESADAGCQECASKFEF